jgi:hypothetical protein
VNNAFIEHSVVGIRSRINSNVHLKVWCNQLCYQHYHIYLPDLLVMWQVSIYRLNIPKVFAGGNLKTYS